MVFWSRFIMVKERLTMTRYMRVSRAAKELGISRTRLYKLVENGKVPHIDMDGYIVIDMDTQDRWDWFKSEEKTKTPKNGG
jgi:excisionase family DNA binding protein